MHSPLLHNLHKGVSVYLSGAFQMPLVSVYIIKLVRVIQGLRDVDPKPSVVTARGFQKRIEEKEAWLHRVPLVVVIVDDHRDLFLDF